MQPSSVLSNPANELRVEYRAARPEEIRDLDVAGEVIPAFVLMTADEWRQAVAPFTRERRLLGGGHHVDRRVGVPGWSIWAQLASRNGEVIVGGRDDLGFPAIPIARANGDIEFSLLPPGDEVSPDVCRPVISAAGLIVCSGEGCTGCLEAVTLSDWYSMISCRCSPRSTRHGDWN